MSTRRIFMKKYSGRNLDLISYPMGGIGAGMICLQGTGSLGSVSLRNKPDIGNEPMIFSAVTILGKENISYVIEAPVPDPNFFIKWKDSGSGLSGKTYGLPRFSSGEFSTRFPFATLKFSDENMPVSVELTGWSPFIPNDEDNSSLPYAALEYKMTNTGGSYLEAVYYFCAENFMRKNDNARVRAIPNGFILEQPDDLTSPSVKGAFCASVDEKAYIDTAWFRGGFLGVFETLTMLWKNISDGICVDKKHPDVEYGASSGGTLSVPFKLAPKESKTIKVHLSWYVPDSELRIGEDEDGGCCSSGCNCGDNAPLKYYKPWYVSRFSSIDEANNSWLENYDSLYNQTRRFTDCFYDSTLPDEIIDAVSANLCILKSPTLLRQTDGRLWGWEGCGDSEGYCYGSCTHVWNYAQSICHLFPRLERSLRETEFNDTQSEASGHQTFRAYLPIRKIANHTFHAASDGQLGGIIKVYRDWRISGDTSWLQGIWNRVKQSMDYCISTWDPHEQGVLVEPHHNTYDIEFWGPDGMCSSFYIGALQAIAQMARAMGESDSYYLELAANGRKYLEEKLFNGEYFIQDVYLTHTKEIKTIGPDTKRRKSPEAKALFDTEGPKSQYGSGCLSDGILGIWLAEICGMVGIIDEEKLKQNLASIYKYNFKKNLSAHSNPQRCNYAAKKDAGLLLCTWPKGGKPSLPFPYSDEVWTGIEYQVACHLIMKGFVQEGLDIITGCRNRYDGIVRNPYNEYEAGHWYARAMASYALLQAYTGVRYDNLTNTLYVSTVNNVAYRTFLSTATGYGTVEVIDGNVKVDVASGYINIKEIINNQG